jgi:hypothetical protein
MEIDEKRFEQLKEQVKQLYSSLGEIRCPYFDENVHFSAEGFYHILYKGSANPKKRDPKSQIMRLKLFKLAPKLLGLTKTLQDYYVEKQFIQVKLNKRKVKILKEVCYWGFIAIIDERRIKVVVKQVGDGNKKFWSIIPNWGSKKNAIGERIIVRHTGDLEND